MKKITIIVAAHKAYPMPDMQMYLPVQVGSAISAALPYVRDDTGRNISEKNKTFCELSACPLDNIVMAMVKRLMDIAGSALAILLLSPVMLATAIGVKLSSPGPVFFVQEWVGRNRKIFKMLKFRSMCVNDRENTGWSVAADPRKTTFGRFIRKTSIDELSQLFNVLAGQMSLVGPRPEIPYHVDHFKEEIPQYLLRQKVRPGMTGWAQVNGFRGDTSIKERVRLDLWYINHWCLRLDLKILLKTAFGGFVNEEKVGIRK